MITTRIIITGLVQGVGFRYFTLKLADKYGLTGWVRNNADGTVEMIVSGDEATVQLFTNEVIMGNRYSRIDGIDIKTLEKRKFNSFEIITNY